ncbi:ImmA/IrrE family metallo-endopeptidase [Saccharopolyspora sp. K220]|uniref:ImmA/IrrE family metallo-endopeptidase n=1 Tax=Saccharopolyspora soli TaxID=2926618 RepID=UPI001F5838AA|nr:ImmA/IrrE family metallo-endopeptidase [Saccharopolyspora soli]MCI2418327.1 ImmA/IrrE family metallo-endopeptidase [Saccharopolyspora soli]
MSSADSSPMRGERLRQLLTADGTALVEAYRSLELTPHTGWLAEVLADRRDPTMSELARLSVHTEIPLAVLVGATDPRANLGVALRSGLVESDVDERADLRRAQHLLEHLRLLTSWYGAEAADRSARAELARRACNHTPYAPEAARRTAQNLRSILGIADDAPIGDLTEIVESIGVPVVVLPLPPNVHGMTVHDECGDDWRSVVFVSSHDPWTRQRYTLAHELAHVLFRDRRTFIIERGDEIDESDVQEWRAECFAGRFLAPEAAVRNWWNAARQDVEERDALARFMLHFGLSRLAAVRTLRGSFPNRDFTHLTRDPRRVADLMELAGLGEQWRAAGADESEPAASPWLLSMSLDAYRDRLVSAEVVADVLGDPDVTAVERDLVEQGWAPPA